MAKWKCSVGYHCCGSWNIKAHKNKTKQKQKKKKLEPETKSTSLRWSRSWRKCYKTKRRTETTAASVGGSLLISVSVSRAVLPAQGNMWSKFASVLLSVENWFETLNFYTDTSQNMLLLFGLYVTKAHSFVPIVICRFGRPRNVCDSKGAILQRRIEALSLLLIQRWELDGPD